MRVIIRNKLKKIGIIMVLSAAVFPMCWILWVMFTGVFMQTDELKQAIGPVLAGDEGMVSWGIFPAYPTLQPITELLLDTPQVFVMFWNSARTTAASVAGQLFVGSLAAWALSRLHFRGRGVLTVLYLSLMLLPFQVTMVPNYLMTDFLNLMDTHWAVILPFVFSAFPVFIMTKGFDAVPIAVLEASKVDGAGYFVTFVKIGLPLGIPGILSALVLGFLECWNAIEQPLLFLKTETLLPLSLYLPRIAAEKMGSAMTASILMLLPAALVFLFGQKYLVLGIQASGIKE